MKKRVLLLSGALLCAGTLLWSAPQRPAEVVAAAKTVEMNASISKKYIGRLVADKDVALIPRVSGILQKRCFTPGEMVKKGQLLFEIEDTSYRAQRDSAKAKLDECEAQYRYAKQNLARMQTLREQKAKSESAFEEAVRQEATAKASVAAAKAALADAENMLSYTRIYSPIDGRADWATVSVNNYVTPSIGTLLTVVADDPIELKFAISARDFARMFGSYANLKKHGEIFVELPDGKIYPCKGDIAYMGTRVDQKTDTISIRAYIENKERLLLPDSLTAVHLSCVTDKKVVGIAPSALLTDGKGDFVYVLNQANIPVRRSVTAGEIQNGKQIITSGLSVGETIVVDGTHKIVPGVPVSPVFAGEK